MQQVSVLRAGSDKAADTQLAGLLRQRGIRVIDSARPDDALRLLETGSPDLIVLGPCSQGVIEDEIGLAARIRRFNRTIPLILITANSSEDLAVAALRVGVNDYFRAPYSGQEVVESIDRCLAAAQPSRSEVHNSPKTGPCHGDGRGHRACRPDDMSRMIGDSPTIRNVREFIRKVAGTDSSVLVTGETGTGKELVAELIHDHSPRRHSPFVAINCAAVPDTLLESEFFGYERGSFTGADSTRDGKLMLARNGTVFFDEIGDMTPFAQAKVLRVFEKKELHRLGSGRPIPLNFRVIAATNQDLERRVMDDRFRKDLYFRVNVTQVHLPPLRERKQDIPLLLRHYLRELNQSHGMTIEGFTDDALDVLMRYDWPGNVREVRNFLEAVFVEAPARHIRQIDFPSSFRGHRKGGPPPQTERERLVSTLLSTDWNKSRAAKQLHWSRMTLYRKMAKYRLSLLRGSGSGDDR